jgi:hypothetical protein
MNVRTLSLHLRAPKAKVFGYLADILNVPKWATEFCKKLEVENGNYWVTTGAGKILFRIVADEKTGVIDFKGGPSPSQMETWPARVVELPDRSCLFLFSILQGPGVSDAMLEGQCAQLTKEFANIKAALA